MSELDSKGMHQFNFSNLIISVRINFESKEWSLLYPVRISTSEITPNPFLPIFIYPNAFFTNQPSLDLPGCDAKQSAVDKSIRTGLQPVR